ncbi:tetratricopeptide repeat protein, partial [Actinoplanes sp. RD1]|uniref:tetratricopeptide repeat protein n=1 Tax=Actinoplanes sp. RD1 TaxID=3064538 RepID=UPI0027424B88
MTFSALPDPGTAATLDDLTGCLRALKVWAGDPAYGVITSRINAERPATAQVGRTTVVDCFRTGRRRLDSDLVTAIVHTLHPDTGYVTQWRQALRVVNGEARAAAQVRVQAELPEDLPGFTGRADELAYAREAEISVLVGMAGVGKTRLAVHLGHELLREQRVDRVLFVDLRGFHPDPAQPPADPGAVLDGFLRLLGVSGQQVPHGLAERTAAWHDRLAGSRTLVVLDNATGAEQVRPLLPEVPGCVTLVTSRRRLPELSGATHCDVDVFRPGESHRFLAAAVPGIPAGNDPDATARVARLCGHLPLALALVAGHMRAKPGWTLTDHADWLEERHGTGRLDVGVELALDVSYRELPDGERALLRALALHPGQDSCVHAAAALGGTTVELAAQRLAKLAADNLVQPAGPGRYALHDLVRAYAATRAADEDRRSARRDALTRLLDFYLAAAAEAMNRLDPAEAGRRPKVTPSPVALPALDEPIAWLDTERTNLVAAAVHADDNGLPGHAVQFSAVLFRYLIGGHHLDAMTVHDRAARAAERTGDLAGQATALASMSTAEVLTGRHEAALARLGHALQIFQVIGDVPGQARTLNTLGIAETRLGRYEAAARHLTESMDLHGAVGNAAGQARARTNLANLESRLGRDEEAVPLYEAVLRFHEEEGDRVGEAVA